MGTLDLRPVYDDLMWRHHSTEIRLADPGTTLTIGPGVTVSNIGGEVSGAANTLLVNRGTITAGDGNPPPSSPGQPNGLTIGVAVENHGLIKARYGGTVYVAPAGGSVTGTFTAEPGGTVHVYGTVGNAARSVLLTGGGRYVLGYQSDFGNAGGSVTVSGGEFVLDSGATFTGGRVELTDGAVLRSDYSFAYVSPSSWDPPVLDGVWVSGAVAVPYYFMLDVRNGLRLDGALDLGGSVRFQGSQTLTGAAAVTMSGGGLSATDTLTFDAGVQVQTTTYGTGGWAVTRSSTTARSPSAAGCTRQPCGSASARS